MNGAIARSASAVVAPHLATRAAMRQERVTQGNPRPVQPDGQRPTVQTEIGGDVGPVFAVEIDFPDEIGIDVPQFAQKPPTQAQNSMSTAPSFSGCWLGSFSNASAARLRRLSFRR